MSDPARPFIGITDCRAEQLNCILQGLIPKVGQNDACDGIPYRYVIDGICRDLALTKRRDRKNESLTRKQAFTDITSLKVLATKLAAEQNAFFLLPLEIRSAVIAISHLEVPQVTIKGELGAPKKIVAAQVARKIAFHYYHLTGNYPSRHPDGIFLHTLKQVFEVLDLKASADNQAKDAIRFLEKSVGNKFP